MQPPPTPTAVGVSPVPVTTPHTAIRQAMTVLFLAAVSGLLFALALPPRSVEPVGWFAFVPLLIAIRLPGLRPTRMLYILGLGMISGLVCGVAQVGWGSAAGALQFAYLPYVWIALVIGCVAAFAGQAARLTCPNGLRWVITVACAGVAVEWLTTFSPLPVGIALCQYHSVPILQIADTTGIWGVSFLLWFVNAAIAEAIARRRWLSLPVAVAAGLVVTSLAYGALRLRHVERQETVTVAAIQDYSGGDTAGFGTTVADATSTLEKEDLIRDAARRGARLIVGTEEAWGAAFRPNDASDAVAQLARETRSSLVVGFSQDAPPVGGDQRGWNSAALVGPDGATRGVHHKMRLFLGERQTVRPGDRAHAFASPLGRIGLLICFDSCYTNATRQATADGARIIAMPNFDPPTPHAVLHELHAALMPFRAVENRVAFIRADPNGLSQIIDPDGRIVAVTPLRRSEALVAAVRLGDGRGTFFTRWGDWLAYGCVGVTAAFLLLGIKPGVGQAGAALRQSNAADSPVPAPPQ